MGQGPALSGARRGPTRRTVLAATALAATAPLAACWRDDAARWQGGWIGASDQRGHVVRDGWPTTKSDAPPQVARTRRVGVVVVGAGIAGLAAARALRAAGVDDCHALELEDSAGGNSRGHALAGMRCPLGAHYLPVPGPAAIEVGELLEELGVRRSEHGRAVYDERMLCHSPQERILVGGGWRDGVLPPVDALPASERAATLAQYRAFAAAVAAAGDADAFAIPTARARWNDSLTALDRTTFAAWLDARGLVAPALRWYLTTAAATTTAPPAPTSRRGRGCTTSRAGMAFARRATRRATAASPAFSPGPKAMRGSPSGSRRRSASDCMPDASSLPSRKAAMR